ncbi:hypothetical protein ISS42_01235 [Candidatus Shapirobacteria bacterium]|nr:hypothetical protein [Candidatus Shapirobacteria bacterium]
MSFPLSFWLFAKACLLFALGLYIIFALVLLRQVYMMAQVISSPHNWLIKIFAWAHLFGSLLVFLFAFVIL